MRARPNARGEASPPPKNTPFCLHKYGECKETKGLRIRKQTENFARLSGRAYEPFCGNEAGLSVGEKDGRIFE